MRVTKTPRRQNKTLGWPRATRAPYRRHASRAHVVVEMLSYTTADKRAARHFITRLNGPLYVMLCVCASAVGKILSAVEHFRHAAVYLGCNCGASAIPAWGDSVIHGKFGAPALSLSMERVLLCGSHEWRNKRAAKIMRALRAVMTRESRSIRMQSLRRRRRREQERTGRMDGSRWWRARFIHRRWISTRPAKIKPAEWIGCWQLVYKNINATPIAWKIERLPRPAAVRAAACAGMQL